MSPVLLDTCVVSEAARADRDRNVALFLERNSDVLLSVITVHELAFGIARLGPGRRSRDLGAWLQALKQRYSDRIRDVDLQVGDRAAALRSNAQSIGRTLHLADALIAATADIHGCVLATRHVKDFEYLHIGLTNPWEGPMS